MRRSWVLSVTFLVVLSTQVLAQSLISGDISGTVSDPTGAVLAEISVTLTGSETGSSQSTTTSALGTYRFSLLKPGLYFLVVDQPVFEKAEVQVSVAVGQTATVNITMRIGQLVQVVKVSGAVPLINPETHPSTSFNQKLIESLPNPGGDLGYIAQTAPGMTMNTSGGAGAFTANGLPATANVFTVNGEDITDPGTNTNITGSTNLTLGLYEVQEATVVTNPYSGQYGELAGAQVNYVTKSGTNAYHGGARYLWNGSVLNANDWFANRNGTPRPFANNNQWGADFGGPIKKDKLFFYGSTEGLRYVLPVFQDVYYPTHQLIDASLGYLATNGPASVPYFQQLYRVWGEPVTAQGRSITSFGGTYCSDIINVGADGTAISSNLPGFDANSPCVNHFIGTPTQLSSEWILSGRLDWNASNHDMAYLRFRTDQGHQASYTDPISPAFNATSEQPFYGGQIQWTHLFSSNATNQFMFSVNWFSAMFRQNEKLANQQLENGFGFLGIPLTTFGSRGSFPTGENVTHYQFMDDFSQIHGAHTFKFGLNFVRYDTSRYGFTMIYPQVLALSSMLELVTDTQLAVDPGAQIRWRKNYNNTGQAGVPIALYRFGGYVQDDWRLSSNLKLSLALRLEHNSNPVCQTNCFVRMPGAFANVPGGSNVPYNQMLVPGQSTAFAATDAVNVSPRLGFAWSPFASGDMVVSGGFGLFYNALGTDAANSSFRNAPNVYVANVLDTPFGDGGVNTLNSTAGSVASLSNEALYTGFTSGVTYADLAAASGGTFIRPGITNFAGTMHTPRFEEWNLQFQQAITRTMAFSLNYVGNHGSNIPILNWPNTTDPIGFLNGYLPQTRPNNAFGTVIELYSAGKSNFNGITASLSQGPSHGLAFQVNYTWSHTLDEVSNGGEYDYGVDSFTAQINPRCLHCANYGNADYDIRQNLTARFVYNSPSFKSNKTIHNVLGDWMVAGTIFARSGLPYTVWDFNTVLVNNGLASLPSQSLNPSNPTYGQTGNCSNGNSQCLEATSFYSYVDAQGNFVPLNGFPMQTRNQYRGPSLFNINLGLTKNFKLGERVTFGVGANFYNLLNHPNFQTPDWGLGSPTFGQIIGTINSPASPYGADAGSIAAPRMVQLQAQFVF
jgi:Carboxypeptidase regulatory-like domain